MPPPEGRSQARPAAAIAGRGDEAGWDSGGLNWDRKR